MKRTLICAVLIALTGLLASCCCTTPPAPTTDTGVRRDSPTAK